LHRHMSVNACLAPLCSMHGLAITTVEGIGSTRTKLHAVQVILRHHHHHHHSSCFCIVEAITDLKPPPIIIVLSSGDHRIVYVLAISEWNRIMANLKSTKESGSPPKYGYVFLGSCLTRLKTFHQYPFITFELYSIQRTEQQTTVRLVVERRGR